jgi:predicted AAA+ superfamily ATPase
MGDAFGWNLDEWIYYGGYPGSAGLIKEMRRWRKYIKESLVAPAVEKDVILTSNIYRPALMKQLFELGCSYSAELLSLTKALGQLQDAGNVTTLSSYLEILNQSNLLAGLQKYANDEARRYQSVPKYQVYNNALLTAYKGTSYEKDRIDPQIWGRWVESAVGAYLLGEAEEEGYKVYYWRERSDEVDFVIVRQQADACNGDIVVALVNGESATVKRYFLESDCIKLQPENDDMEPFYERDVRILGKVIGVYRQM